MKFKTNLGTDNEDIGPALQHYKPNMMQFTSWQTYIDGWLTETQCPKKRTTAKIIMNGVTSYNAAHMNRTRASQISKHVPSKALTIQATGRQSEERIYYEKVDN